MSVTGWQLSMRFTQPPLLPDPDDLAIDEGGTEPAVPDPEFEDVDDAPEQLSGSPSPEPESTGEPVPDDGDELGAGDDSSEPAEDEELFSEAVEPLIERLDHMTQLLEAVSVVGVIGLVLIVVLMAFSAVVRL